MIALEELFPPEHVLVLRPRDKAAALAELAKRAAMLLGGTAESSQSEAARIAQALVAREALGSTGIGAGIALPHARLEMSSGPLALFTRLERPIPWDSIDRAPVDLVFMLLSPTEPADLHLKLLAMVTRRLRDGAVAAALRATTDPAALRTRLIT
jgi:PTS system nitrogen regulatory IIA component